jgi:two-component system cell cycle response regulator CpdR
MMRIRHGHRAQGKVMVADWDRTHALTLAAIMDRPGFRVETAFNGNEAVLKAATFLPDLMVTEPFLDGVTGIEAAAQIAAAHPGCRVLFLSSGASFAEVAKDAPRTLVYSFIAKSVHPLDLLNTTAYMLSAEWSSDDAAWNPIVPDSSSMERTSVTCGFDLEQTIEAAVTAN